MLNRKIKNVIKAFSVAELLVVFVFASFILIYELVILNRKTNQYGAIYYNAYNTLKKVAYNVYADTYCPDPSISSTSCKHDCEQCKKGIRKFPETPEGLCLRLAEYMNIPDARLSCGDNNSQAVNDLANDINSHLMFQTSNGNKFYISDLKTVKIKNNNAEKEVKYFIVYIDINGNRTPNKVNIIDKEGEEFEPDKMPKNKILPDIVPFIVTTEGEVAPAGAPVYTKAYLTAKVRYPIKQLYEGKCSDESIANKDNGLDSICYYSGSMSFNEAVHKAWGEEPILEFVLSYPAIEFLDSDNLAIKGLKIPDNPAIDNGEEHGCEEGSNNCMISIDESDKVRL